MFTLKKTALVALLFFVTSAGAQQNEAYRLGAGDKVAISSDVFDGVNKIKFKVVNGKDEINDAASTKKILIYDDKKGMLYFNENGKKDGFGDGGEFAKLLGAPDLGKEDFVLA